MPRNLNVTTDQIDTITSMVMYHFLPVPGNELDAIIAGIADLMKLSVCLGKKYPSGLQNPDTTDYVMAAQAVPGRGLRTPFGAIAIEIVVLRDLIDIRFVTTVFGRLNSAQRYKRYEINTSNGTCDGCWLNDQPIRSSYSLADLDPQEMASNIDRLILGSPYEGYSWPI